MYLSPIITDTAMWLLCASFACVLVLTILYIFRVRSVVKFRRRADHERPDKPDADYLPASVIIYSQGEAESLDAMLRTILNQDYPSAYEVIVVNDGESVEVRDTVSMYRASHNNVYLTFTPQGVVNLSRKKLALTLGIKAARYDVVVLTTTAAEIESQLWLKRMMRPFDTNGKTEVVLGYAYIDPDEDRGFGARRRAFDHVAESVRWLGTAIARHPFRGTEYNIAYLKQTFLKNKGFAHSLNLHYGDDDIFVSEICKPGKTEVELSEDSIVRLRHGNHPRLFKERMLRRIFTEGHIRRRPRILFGLIGWLQIIAIATAVTAGVISYPNLQASLIGAVIVITMTVIDIIMWRQAMKALKSRPLALAIPWLSVTYPIRRCFRHLQSRFGKQKKYTWD